MVDTASRGGNMPNAGASAWPFSHPGGRPQPLQRRAEQRKPATYSRLNWQFTEQRFSATFRQKNESFGNPYEEITRR
ncbi:hypothetical protein SAMN05216499_11718 [Actinacidiphila paucisporea]|uniref:Uncharacterized protein n=1 Tax=Actinacidiphila paucisporea TaxID=310782 RepID=A0A1M7MWC0_9ACTN|nr:hypothetical protein SAMN05216499_11718 [Actinacidiphila paucisporea]